MLKALKVKNYALISDVDLSFDRGLNIITGETGAGKSILIEALGLVLGNRADSNALRNQSNKCIIEATFKVGALEIQDFFEHNDLDYEQETIVRREITTSGKSRAFINDTPVSLKIMNALGEQLLEIHSQYDNLRLFSSVFQFALLDVMSENRATQQRYEEAYTQYKLLEEVLAEKEHKEAELAKERDFNQFLFDELSEAELSAGEEEKLESEQELLDNAENLLQLFQSSDQILSSSERSIVNQLSALEHELRQGGRVTEELEHRVRSVRIELEDIASELAQLSSKVDLDPRRLEEVNERLGVIFSLRNKHRVKDLEELMVLMASLDTKLQQTSDLSSEIEILRVERVERLAQLRALADEMHERRQDALSRVELEINNMLEPLGMPHSKLRFALTKSEDVRNYGWNDLEIQLSSDKGQYYTPLKKAASGGELSRINLVIKSLLSQYRSLPSSIFDEIDTGVSGEIARRVGGLMLNMAQSQQVISITHLPQIASLGQQHFFVSKSETLQGVETRVRLLSRDERIHEIAKMISGEDLTESAIEQSKMLLGDQ